MRSFFDTFPARPRFDPKRPTQLLYHAIVCPEEGKLGRDFKPVDVQPWAPEPRQTRPRAKRPVSVERVEEINEALTWDASSRPRTDDPHFSDATRVGEAGTDEPLELGHQLGHFDQDDQELYEFDDPRYFEPGEAGGIRSLVQPRMSSADYSWRAPAARCRSCGCETWVASIADGIRMIRNPRHRAGCTAPPSRLEVEQSCGE